MNGRTIAAEVMALAAVALWLYAGGALLIAATEHGAALSLGAMALVVVVSYLLARLLSQLDVSETALRAWGAGLSIALLYLILRVEIAGEAYLWELGWLLDLISQPGSTLDGHAGDATTVLVLSVAWLHGIIRGGRSFTFDTVLGEVGLGLFVVFVAAAFAGAAEAPDALRWLPILYMVAAFSALALAHLQSTAADPRRPFLGAWLLWIGGLVGVIAGLALLAVLWEPPSLAPVGDIMAAAGRAIGLTIVLILTPPFIAVAFLMQFLIGWLSGEPFIPEPLPDTADLIDQVDDEESGTPRWAKVLGYALRAGLVALGIVVAFSLLWLLFRRFSRRREQEALVREQVEAGEGGLLGDLRSIFAGALDRLRGRGGAPLGRDPIGRLYVSMLRRAATDGLPRPPAATPLEFAPRLDEHFDSQLPSAISRSYAKARYGLRPPSAQEVEKLRSQWEVDPSQPAR